MIEDIFDLIAGNLGLSFENLILVLTILGSLIFFAKDLRLGAIVLFMLLASEFIIFYELGMESFTVLMAFMCNIVILTLSLYITHNKTAVGII